MQGLSVPVNFPNFSGIIMNDRCPICGSELKIQRIGGNVFSRCLGCGALSSI